MTFYCVGKTRSGKRVVTVVVETPQARSFYETPASDPELPEWVRNAEIGNYDETGELVVPA